VAASLRGRALAALSRREHSRLELRRKLAPHAESEAALETVLDVLERERLLSDERFAESLIYRRSDRFGAKRIEKELSQHALDADFQAAALATLKSSEFERCKRVWQGRFGALPKDLKERGRQTRFLLARGFEGEVIQRVLKGTGED
jgi:regulatory protein